MNFTRTLQITATLILGLGEVGGVSGGIQTYYYSGPVSGAVQVALTPEGVGYGSFIAEFGTVSETLYYDPVAQTLRVAGSLSISPSSGFFDISDGLPELGQVAGSASLTVGHNGSFSFDCTSAGGGGIFTLNLLVPVSGSGVYQGRWFTGRWELLVQVITEIIAVSPASLTFSQQGDQNPPGQIVVPALGLASGTGDCTYEEYWDPSSCVAWAVPGQHNRNSPMAPR